MLFPYFLSGCTDENQPEVFTIQEAISIKKMVVKHVNKMYKEEGIEEVVDIDDCGIHAFLGEYNGAYVCAIERVLDGGPVGLYTDIVAGYEFIVSGTFRIDVYYKGDFYFLLEAYEKGILSKENIENIYNKYEETGRFLRKEKDFFEQGYTQIICDTNIKGIVLYDENSDDLKFLYTAGELLYNTSELISLEEYLGIVDNKQSINYLSKYIKDFNVNKYINWCD